MSVTPTQPALMLHIIPVYSIGGVEVAAEAGAEQSSGAIRVHALVRDMKETGTRSEWITQGPPASPFGLRAMASVVQQVRRHDPPVILFSLWRSVLAFSVLRCLYPKKKFAVLLHSSKPVHWADALATKWMMFLAHEIWADSQATLDLRLPSRAKRPRTKAISFVLERPSGLAHTISVGPNFVSWCRLSREKRIERALTLIANLKERLEGVTYSIIGPDAGVRDDLEFQCHHLGLESVVRFLGPKDRGSIKLAAAEATFFLQLSAQEGQSLAVVEAMQQGLVPVVTPVGAIAEYCFDGVNAVIFDNLGNTADRLAGLLASPAEVRRLSKAAQEQFANPRLYVEDMLEAAKALSDQAPSRELR